MAESVKQAQSIVGYSADRDSADFYPTPPSATEALLSREKFVGKVWEPASGDGAMSRIIEKYHSCISSDIREDEGVYGTKGYDFIGDTHSLFGSSLDTSGVENIITNPPFRYAPEFIQKSKTVATRKIALLLKLQFLEGASRYEMFHDEAFPLARVYVFSKRLTMTRRGEIQTGTGMLAFAWYVWDKDHIGSAMIDWIKE